MVPSLHQVRKYKSGCCEFAGFSAHARHSRCFLAETFDIVPSHIQKSSPHLAFTRALTCLSRFGEDVSLIATPEHLALASTNSSHSAYARFKFEKGFFSRYSLATGTSQDSSSVSGQLLTKAILSILKQKTIEKGVEKCDLSIVEGSDDTDAEIPEDEDTLECKLVLKLHCKHGVVKTHRLLLSTPTTLRAPELPEGSTESTFTVGPRTVRDIIEQFPAARGGKADPQLIWAFGESQVSVRTMPSTLDARGKASVSSELTISAEEFTSYNIPNSPIVMAFHLREFSATVAFAESMLTPLEFRFTDPDDPLFIEVEGDCFEALFIIATNLPTDAVLGSQKARNETGVAGASSSQKTATRDQANGLVEAERAKRKKPNKVVYETPPASAGSMSVPNGARQGLQAAPPNDDTKTEGTPLFLPSQVLVGHPDDLEASGLGLEHMTAAELADVLEGEGCEIEPSQAIPASQTSHLTQTLRTSDESFKDRSTLEEGKQSRSEGSRSFVALFND